MSDSDAEDQHTLTATTSRRHRQTAQDAQEWAIGTPIASVVSAAHQSV